MVILSVDLLDVPEADSEVGLGVDEREDNSPGGL